MGEKKRVEKDILGEVEIPEEAYWGINTQRTLLNFQISGYRFPESFLFALAKVKKACLRANLDLEVIKEEKGTVILQALDELLEEKDFLDQFPIDVFQTGSGTQINMNMNEVLANRANELLGHPKGQKQPVHPNDDINKSQSSNDVIPTAMNLSTLDLLHEQLFPALDELITVLETKIGEFQEVVKIGRTHLQDAVPIPLSMEFSVYHRQMVINKQRLENSCKELYYLPLGGTAVGTGLNAPKNFAKQAVSYLTKITGYPFKVNPVKAEGISSHNSLVKMSGTLRLLALSLRKMANDIRWMGSGPRAGLGELLLPQNEPGSSIMPGKINPTQAEALVQVCLQTIGNDTIISLAEFSGSKLDLNVCKPLIIFNLLESIKILANGITSFVQRCLKGLEANHEQIASHLQRSLMLVTNLSPIIGYDKAAEIAQRAHQTGKTIQETITEMGVDIKGDINELLDPKKMV
ncbi:MAG: aspartate ammonia-lyase [Candidatus Heimdallarchaeota archaeon]|nr:aspartate ammonia-lyase [Candidatus Heimdallarchaeota archaeon]